MEGRTFSDSWYKVANLKVSLRDDLNIRKQYFQGEEWYVLQDPLSNKFFRFRPEVYEFLARLNIKNSLEEIWNQCMEINPERTPGQDDVIKLLSSLYNSNLLYFTSCPDNAKLFERYSKRRNQELKGKLIVERRGWPFARLATIYTGDEWMTNYLKKLKTQKLVICKGIGVTGNLLAAGAGAVCMPLYLYQLNMLKAQGAPVDWFRQNPLGYSLRLQYVTTNAPHPNAARLWAGWFSSREGVNLWEDITTQGIVLPGSGTKARKLIEKESIEMLTEKNTKELTQSRNNMKKYRKILMGK